MKSKILAYILGAMVVFFCIYVGTLKYITKIHNSKKYIAEMNNNYKTEFLKNQSLSFAPATKLLSNPSNDSMSMKSFTSYNDIFTTTGIILQDSNNNSMKILMNEKSVKNNSLNNVETELILQQKISGSLFTIPNNTRDFSIEYPLTNKSKQKESFVEFNQTLDKNFIAEEKLNKVTYLKDNKNVKQVPSGIQSSNNTNVLKYNVIIDELSYKDIPNTNLDHSKDILSPLNALNNATGIFKKNAVTNRKYLYEIPQQPDNECLLKDCFIYTLNSKYVFTDVDFENKLDGKIHKDFILKEPGTEISSYGVGMYQTYFSNSFLSIAIINTTLDKFYNFYADMLINDSVINKIQSSIADFKKKDDWKKFIVALNTPKAKELAIQDKIKFCLGNFVEDRDKMTNFTDFTDTFNLFKTNYKCKIVVTYHLELKRYDYYVSYTLMQEENVHKKIWMKILLKNS